MSTDDEGLCDKSKEELIEIIRQQKGYILQLRGQATSRVFSVQKSTQTTNSVPEKSAEGVLQDVPLTASTQRDVLREYFFLLVQAVKVNAVYMDYICDVPAEDLYKEATSKCVPFYQWHEWVDVELHKRFLLIKVEDPSLGKVALPPGSR